MLFTVHLGWSTEIHQAVFSSDENLSAIQPMSLNDKIKEEKLLLSQNLGKVNRSIFLVAVI